MKTYRIISDLHLESRNKIPDGLWADEPSDERVLILAGDIGDPYDELYKIFLQECKQRYSVVILVAGNREFYNTDIHQTPKEEVDSISRVKKNSEGAARKKSFTMNEIEVHLDNLCKETGCIFLNRTSHKIDGVTFIGCPLWNIIPPHVQPAVMIHEYNLFKYVRVTSEPLTVDEYQHIHHRDVQWLDETINKKQYPSDNIVVITHYPPTTDFRQPRYHEDFLASMYENDLHSMMNSRIKLWICGHSHHAVALRNINGITLASNPVGSIGHSDTYSNYNRNFSLSI